MPCSLPVAEPEPTATSGVRVDAHAHVFERGLALASHPRYVPDYDATPAAYLAHLDAGGLTHGVLVQPSFLGTDNAYLLAALAEAPQRLRGIAVVEPACPREELVRLSAAGVVGMRLNLIGAALPRVDAAPWRTLLRHARSVGWQVEVQCEAARLPDFVPGLLDAGVVVVIDHFGLPDPVAGASDRRWRALLALAARASNLYVKLSAPYRLGPDGSRLAAALATPLREAFGPARLLFGTDWPHTQHEHAGRMRTADADLRTWLPGAADRDASFAASAALFGFVREAETAVR